MSIRGNVLIQGASRGIGLELVRQLRGRPGVTRLLATCRDPDSAMQLRELTDAPGVEVSRLDLTEEATIVAAAEWVRARMDRIHLLVNVSGVLHGEGLRPERRLEDIEPENLARSFQVNAFGPLLMAKHFRDLCCHDEPSVFASLSARVSSISDNRLGGWYAYRASKAAQNQFTRCAAIEFRRKSRQTIVVGLHPGTVDTDLSKPFQRNVEPQKLFTVQVAVGRLIDVIEGLTPKDTGNLFAWDGQLIPF